jgi:hypothetical protein
LALPTGVWEGLANDLEVCLVPTVIAHHQVKDTQHWLSSTKREEVLGPLGASNIRTFVDQQNPRQVAVLMDGARRVLPETLSILVAS